MYRDDFLEASIQYADDLRIRAAPDLDTLGARIIEDCGKLRTVRDNVVDWILLEQFASESDDQTETLLQFLEKLLELKSRPEEITSYNESWFGAHAVFVYELFLYMVAALLKVRAYPTIHEVYASHYLPPKNERYGDLPFVTFDSFYGYCDAIQSELSEEGRRYHSPSAEVIHRQADRDDIPFLAIAEAELLTFLMTLLTDGARWYPGTLNYHRHSAEFRFFLRAAQHKNFAKLAIITGETDASELRSKITYGIEQLGNEFGYRSDRNLWGAMNMEHLDTIK